MQSLKIQDLRIGNFVLGLNNLKRTILPIASLHGDDTVRLSVSDGSIGCFPLYMIEGIILNTDWLIKFDSKKSGDIYYIPVTNLKAELHFEVFQNEIVTTLKSRFSDLVLDRIKYVHELQNIYFALAKSELPIV